MGYRSVLDGTYDNHMLPFLWMKGEDGTTIAEYLEKIASVGIGEVCLESRPHPDFCGDRWWSDLSFVIDRCRELGLKVWILDDSHFPTGYANGAIPQKHPELAKQTVTHRTVDVVGPCRGAAINIPELIDENEGLSPRILGVTALHEGIARTLNVHQVGTRLFFDLEDEGITRVCVIYTQTTCGFHDDYINMVDKESCNVLIEAVFEPHFKHFADEFGKTILGFFSDEPGFMTEKGEKRGGSVDTLIGKRTMPLPWSHELGRRLAALWGDHFLERMTVLWEDGEGAAAARRAFMDAATDLYRTCFEENIGSWCEHHGVMHIGHVIEDRGCHARLGTGAGHFFRAEAGMGMAGIDVVMNQLVPGIDSGEHPYMRGVWDMEFYAYELARLGSSAAHLDHKKKGRCLAEVFGAFGWHEGLREMKALIDHLLVRGVNYFVPHAFSMAPFPDPDCPPHFYAHGENPQFRYFGELVRYANRTATLLSDGASCPVAAVLYQAEAIWAGEAMPGQKVARELTRAQIEFDFLPLDLLAQDCSSTSLAIDTAQRSFTVNGQTYRCLVLPYAEYTGSALIRTVQRLTEARVPIFVVDALPSKSYDSELDAPLIGPAFQSATVVPLEHLIKAMRAQSLYEIAPSSPQPWLRAYPYCRDGEELWLLVNEHPHRSISTALSRSDGSPLMGAAIDMATSETRHFHGQLELEGGESLLIVAGNHARGALDEPVSTVAKNSHLEISGPWSVSRSSAEGYPSFDDTRTLDTLENLSETCYPDMTGTFSYETSFEVPRSLAHAELHLGEVFEIAEVWLDGDYLGSRIAPPYLFRIGSLAAGPHRIRVEVTNTLEKEVSDPFSLCEPSQPSGLFGPVALHGVAAPS